MPKYLTKSRFKTAYECPTRLYYLEHPEYGNNNRENDFLEALARGGFQVGALAKLYYPGGIDLDGLSTEEGIARTQELLKQDRVVIFEAALQWKDYLVRVDVLEKNGKEIRLIEVKAKSYGFDREDFFTSRGERKIVSTWEPYLVDVAFQTWVAENLFTGSKVAPFLMLSDKTVQTDVDGLHQRFLIAKDNGRSKVLVRPGTDLANVGKRILCEIDVAEEVRFIIEEDLFSGMRLAEYAAMLAQHLGADTRPPIRVGSYCKNCEFRIPKDLKDRALRSGFDECWLASGRVKPEELNEPLIFELWKSNKTDALLSSGVVFMKNIEQADLQPKSSASKKKDSGGEKTGLTMQERQWLQVEKVRDRDSEPYVDKDGLRTEIARLKYPLHFIDFETTMAAIPFHKGRTPYEQIAFQFSHHIMRADGSIAHVDQYIHDRTGEFPNFEFVRRLKASLSSDDGSIFRYADHENTVLRQIMRQLVATPQPDQEDLLDFIRLVTRPTKEEESTGAAPGRRSMTDLAEWIRSYYYHPLMGGSNSIKKVIPAVLEESQLLKEKYCQPNYGSPGGIPSLNYRDWKWIESDDQGRVKDPYKRLPPVFADVDPAFFEGTTLLGDDSEAIDDGGAAMTAWARMQFTEMTDQERSAVRAALLKYCELDTLSMAWIVEYLKDVCIS